LVSYSLIILYRNAVKPLIAMTIQSQQALLYETPMNLGKEGEGSLEVRTVVSSFNQLLQKNLKKDPDDLKFKRREAEFSTIINEATNRLNGIINYSQLLSDSSDTENTNDEQKQIIEKIIHNGEQCAVILRKGIQ
jgi:hypothetical protein